MGHREIHRAARGFLQSAQTIAIRDVHQRITPEHLLKVLLDDEEGAAAGLIRSAGGDRTKVRATSDVRSLVAISCLSSLATASKRCTAGC